MCWLERKPVDFFEIKNRAVRAVVCDGEENGDEQLVLFVVPPLTKYKANLLLQEPPHPQTTTASTIVPVNAATMLTDDEFLCIRQAQLYDTNTDGVWDEADDCPPSSVSSVDIGEILLNPTSCLDIVFKECNDADNRMVLYLFVALILLLSVVTAVFVGRNKMFYTDNGDAKSATSTGEQTTTTLGGSPRRVDLSPESLAEEGQENNPDDPSPPPDESVYFPSLSRTLEEVRLSYEGEFDYGVDNKNDKQTTDEEEGESVQSPGEMFYDDNGSDGSPFRSNSTTGSLSPVHWAHQREAWEEFEHSSSHLDDDIVSICETDRKRSQSLPPKRRGRSLMPPGFQAEL